MEPIPNQALSNGVAGEGLEAFPNAPRTAFYVQDGDPTPEKVVVMEPIPN